ncbi:unnamed protein product [Brassica oleracea]
MYIIRYRPPRKFSFDECKDNGSRCIMFALLYMFDLHFIFIFNFPPQDLRT